MALPRAVAADLRRTARAVAKIPDETMREAVDGITIEAVRIGGSFHFGGRAQTLYAAMAKGYPRTRGKTTTAVVVGKPAGAWAIKTYGRGPSVDRSGRAAMPLFGGYRASVGPAGPARNGNWEDLVLRAIEAYPEFFERAFLEAVS